MLKRGQVTIFLVLGIILLAVFALVAYIVSQTTGEKISLELKETEFSKATKPKIVTFVESCLKEMTLEGINLASKQGGRIFLTEEEILITEKASLTLGYKNGKMLLDPKKTESDIGLYIDLTLDDCIQNFSVFKDESFLVEKLGEFALNPGLVSEEMLESRSDLDSETRIVINEKEVVVTSDFPLKVQREEDNYELNQFTLTISSNLGSAIKTAQDITIRQIETNNIGLSYFSDFEPFIKVFPFDKENTIYSMYYGDESNPPIFLYVIQDNQNNHPQLDFIPNFKLTIGQNFYYSVKAIDLDNDVLTFKSNNPDFPISESGEFSFSPQTIGSFNVLITVSDKESLADEQEVNFKVEES